MNPITRTALGRRIFGSAPPGDEPLFYFEVGGKPVSWKLSSSNERAESIQSEYVSADGRLSVSMLGTVISPHEVIVIKFTLSNNSDAPSEPFSVIEPIRLQWDVSADKPLLARKSGGGVNEQLYPPHAFRMDTVRLDPGGWLWADGGADGLSSGSDMPIVIGASGADGWAAMLEWSGMWRAGIRGRNEDGKQRTSLQILVNGMVLAPREVVALPPVHIVLSDADGLEGATNALRRYLIDIAGPWVDGHAVMPAVIYSSRHGIGANLNEELMLKQVDAAALAGVEYFVLDAGWQSGCIGADFGPGTGNWQRVDQTKFPRGLKPLADRVRSSGMKFGLWFELERAHKDSDWVKQHPTWFWDIGSQYMHLNLTLPEAQNACVETLVSAARELGLKWIKLDYNLSPAQYWRSADPTMRVQFEYVSGLYHVLEEVAKQLPDVLIENSASGGLRLDLGVLGRTHISRISDECFGSENVRYMQAGANYLLPGQTNGAGIAFGQKEGNATCTDYDLACRMLGTVAFEGDLASLAKEDLARLRRMAAVFSRFRSVLPGNFYPLTAQPRDDQEWQVVQFAAYDQKDAVLLGFSGRAQPGSQCRRFRLKGLAPDTTYKVTPLHHCGRAHRTTGASLMKCGIRVHLEAGSWAAWRISVCTPGKKKV